MNKQIITVAVLVGSMMTSVVFAESNGTLGANSNGDVNVNLTVPALVQLTFPTADIDLTYADGSN